MDKITIEYVRDNHICRMEIAVDTVAYDVISSVVNHAYYKALHSVAKNHSSQPILSKASLPWDSKDSYFYLKFKKKSSAIEWARYDSETKVLTVEFTTGSTYEYEDMDIDFVKRFETASSPGSFAANELYEFCGKMID